jgi:hypothetical protein
MTFLLFKRVAYSGGMSIVDILDDRSLHMKSEFSLARLVHGLKTAPQLQTVCSSPIYLFQGLFRSKKNFDFENLI